MFGLNVGAAIQSSQGARRAKAKLQDPQAGHTKLQGRGVNRPGHVIRHMKRRQRFAGPPDQVPGYDRKRSLPYGHPVEQNVEGHPLKQELRGVDHLLTALIE